MVMVMVKGVSAKIRTPRIKAEDAFSQLILQRIIKWSCTNAWICCDCDFECCAMLRCYVLLRYVVYVQNIEIMNKLKIQISSM
jgi:hypothetical protein